MNFLFTLKGTQDFQIIQWTLIILGVNCIVFPAALAFAVSNPGSARAATTLLLTEFVMDSLILITGVRRNESGGWREDTVCSCALHLTQLTTMHPRRCFVIGLIPRPYP